MAFRRTRIALAIGSLALILPMTAAAQAVKTKTQVEVSHATTVFGEPVTFTATVTGIGPWSGITPTGLVSFVDLTSSKALGTAPVNRNGVASIVVASLTPGVHVIQGTFVGSRGQGTSSGKISVTVRREYVVLGADLG